MSTAITDAKLYGSFFLVSLDFNFTAVQIKKLLEKIFESPQR